MAQAGRSLYWLLVIVSGVSLVLVIADMVLAQGNRTIQIEVNQRQNFINQSIQLGRVREALVRSMAQTAMAAKDDKLRDLLAQHGFTINPAPSGATPSAAPAAAAPATPTSNGK